MLKIHYIFIDPVKNVKGLECYYSTQIQTLMLHMGPRRHRKYQLQAMLKQQSPTPHNCKRQSHETKAECLLNRNQSMMLTYLCLSCLQYVQCNFCKCTFQSEAMSPTQSFSFKCKVEFMSSYSESLIFFNLCQNDYWGQQFLNLVQY